MIARMMSTALLLFAPSAAFADGGWTFKKTVDQLTDVPTYMIFSEASPKLQPSTGVGVVCSNGNAAVMFIVGITGLSDTFTVHYRFDKNPPNSVQTKGIDAKTVAVLGNEAPTIIAAMKAHNQMYFRVDLPVNSRSDGTVSLAGFSAALAKFEKHCG